MAKKGTLFGKPREEVVKHPGAFSEKAEKAGKSTAAYARQVTKPGSQASTKTKRQANIAKTFAKLRAGKAKFLFPFVLAALVAPAYGQTNVSCPSGYLTPPGGQTTTGPSLNTMTARAAPAVVFQFLGGGTSGTVQIEMCCSPLNCAPGGSWSPVTGSATTLTTGAYNAAVSILAPTCTYRANITACTSCGIVVAYACSGP